MTRSSLLLAAALCAGTASAQTSPDVAGRWEGTINAGGVALRLVLDIRRTADGVFLGNLTSVDQGNARIPIDLVQVTGASVHLEIRGVRGTYDGTFSGDGSRIAGTWSQGQPLPLELTRATVPADATRGAETAGTTEPVRPPSAQVNPFGVPLDLVIPHAPIPFVGDGRTHLAYEIHVTNFGPSELALRKVEVLSGGKPLASLEGAELNAALIPVGAPPAGASAAGGPPDFRTVPSGRRCVVFIWIALDRGAAVPATLLHRVTVGEQTFEGGPLAVGNAAPLVLGPPLRGGLWVAANGPANASIHRRALLTVGGKARIAQRFAIDWLKLDKQGRAFDGNQADNATYFAHGREALAVADAVVAAVKDGIPENVPGVTSRAVPITLDTIGGNFVTLDLGSGRYAFYAHLRPGSLRVKPGDRVRRGQVLGLVGNSGNSTQPHLHFHVGDSAENLAAEGVPYVIDAFEVFSRNGASEQRRNELPMQNAAVAFPE